MEDLGGSIITNIDSSTGIGRDGQGGEKEKD